MIAARGQKIQRKSDLKSLWGLWGHRLDKTWQKSYWVIWKCAHVNRQTLWILFYRNRFLDSSTRGCGRQRSFAFCPLERRLGGGSTTQTGHLHLCHSSCTFKAFEHRSCFCCSSQKLHASHLVELESGVGLRVDSPPRADVRAALRHDHWRLGSASLFGPIGEHDAGVERTRVRAR